LREVAKRPPYMRDGTVATLAEVVALYNRGGTPNTWLSGDIKPLGLSDSEQKDLIAFMEPLTGEVSPEVASAPTLPK
jgi:cytochrome c peroxidase